GLKVPPKQPKRGRLWLANGSCMRLRPEHRNHVWSYDFVEDRTHDGRKYRMLNVLDEFSHECLAIRVARKLKAIDVIDVCPTSSSCMAFLLTSAPTTDRSSWPRPCRNGSRWPAPRPLTSSGAVLGRTATSRASTRAFATSCSTAKSSTRSERPEFSSRAGGATTTRSGRTPHLDTSQAPEVFVPAFAAWPAALRRAAPPATLAKRPTLN